MPRRVSRNVRRMRRRSMRGGDDDKKCYHLDAAANKICGNKDGGQAMCTNTYVHLVKDGQSVSEQCIWDPNRGAAANGANQGAQGGYRMRGGSNCYQPEDTAADKICEKKDGGQAMCEGTYPQLANGRTVQCIWRPAQGAANQGAQGGSRSRRRSRSSKSGYRNRSSSSRSSSSRRSKRGHRNRSSSSRRSKRGSRN